MNITRDIAIFITAGVSALTVQAGNLDAISNKDATSGLREALTQAGNAAVSQLGTQDGFFGNDRVRIPLPGNLQKAEKLLRTMGMGKQADELELTMNRAAESAVVEAKPILVNAVKKMSWEDAKGILTGGDNAATEYFKRTTSDALTTKFKPIVHQATSRLSLAEKYDAYAGKGAELGLVKKEDANLDDYVTRKALDGLFVIMADKEKAIRQDPIGQTSAILRKVFGAI
ncbi:MAG: DUF4197 domain-containing protein [Burkholderiales bacterium]|nr:DUF4197 domain-containing protein [Burkholderiales bacterium]